MRSVFLPVVTIITTSCLLSSEPVEHLDISLWLEHSRVVADSGLDIRVTAVNRASQAIRLADNCLLGIEIAAPGELPWEYRGGGTVCTTGRPVDLAPGDSVTLVRHLDFRPWFSDQSFHDRSQVTRWSAGRYDVTGYLWNDGHVVRRTPPSSFDLVCRDPTWREC